MTKRLENELRFDERYDLSITDACKGLYTIAHYAKKFGRAVRKRGIAAALLGAMTVGACKLPLPDPIPPVPPTPTENYLDVSGTLEDNENDGIGREGIAEFYDTRNPNGTFSNPIKDKNTGLYEVQTGTNGHFSVTLDKLVDSSDTIYLRAKTGTSGNQTSYKRTIDLPAVDANLSTGLNPRANPAVRVVPYPDFDTNNDLQLNQTDNSNFRNFMAKTNFPIGLQKFPSTYLDNFKGGVIIKNNPDITKGSFTGDALNGQISKIFSKRDDLAKWYEKNSMDMLVRTDNVTNDQINYYLSHNYLVIEPDNSLGVNVYGQSSPGLIRLNPTYNLYDYVILHEGGHASVVSPDEANNKITGGDILIYYPSTVMNTRVPYDYEPVSLSAAKADLKASKLVNERTYQSGEGLDNILGTQ